MIGGKEKTAMRRDITADLEHDFVAGDEAYAARVAAQTPAVAEDRHRPPEAEQTRRAQLSPPDREQIAERRPTSEANDTGRFGRPDRRATTRAAHADPRRDDDGEAIAEQLEVHARARMQRSLGARRMNRGRRLVARTDADRSRHKRKHRLHGIALFLVLIAAGCGGTAAPPSITVPAAHVYRLSGFTPANPVTPGTPTRVSFTILQPNGTPLTQYKHGVGPHNGVHVIIVRRDLGLIIHTHPPVGKNGLISDTITFLAPGPYRVVIDVYPKTTGLVPNFQLFTTLTVAGAYKPQPLPPFAASLKTGGYTFTLQGTPHLRAIVPALLDFTVTGPDGKPARFTPWFGALAHAIFFRRETLDYFHTHVCAPGASGCGSTFGAAKVTGTSAAPGRLQVGVLVPVAGTWRLFLQCRVDGFVVTAPFTLQVR